MPTISKHDIFCLWLVEQLPVVLNNVAKVVPITKAKQRGMELKNKYSSNKPVYEFLYPSGIKVYPLPKIKETSH